MIELYMWTTTNSRRASIGLEEAGLAYTVRPINIRKGDQFTPEYTQLTAYQKVPVMTDSAGPDGRAVTLFESGAILLYAAEKSGRLYGTSAAERLAIQKWFIFHLNSSLPAFRFSMRYPEQLRGDVERVCRVMDQHLAHNRWFADAYSIADIALYPRIANFDQAKYPVLQHRHMARWLAEVGERPAVQRGMAEPQLPSEIVG
jgi:GSH-dependent disulfide-bond oxidoreductase